RGLVDELAPCGVDDPHAVAHLREGIGSDRMTRLVGQRQAQRQELRHGVYTVLRLGAVHAELAETIGSDERIVGDDSHAETGGAPRDLLPDAAEAQHAERLVGELDAAVRLPLPAALLQRRMRLR